VIEFTVLGPAATKGSTRSFLSRGRRGGRPRIVTVADCDRLGPWSERVAWAARAAGIRPAAKPAAVRLSLVFEFQRPRAARGRPDHTVKPDIDKCERAALDALTGIAYEDDSQVVGFDVLEKRYAADGEPGRTVIGVRVLP
jgi:crossover junction endodeoxyribonuclease RusA